jgi:hypothetical protein
LNGDGLRRRRLSHGRHMTRDGRHTPRRTRTGRRPEDLFVVALTKPLEVRGGALSRAARMSGRRLDRQGAEASPDAPP